MQIAHHAKVSDEALAALRAAVPAHGTLMELVAWGNQQTPPVRLQETIALDEYTHEVIVPWRESLWLVYSSTWNGTITAVAVWDHQPDAEELLAARLQTGWQPTPSPLREGDVVLGHAACLLH